MSEDEPDFDLDVVPRFFASARLHEPGNPYFDPANVAIKVGFYVSYQLLDEESRPSSTARTPRHRRVTATSGIKVELPIPGTDTRFTTRIKYVLKFYDTELKLTGTDTSVPSFDLDGFMDRIGSAGLGSFHFTISRVLGDAVHDDDAELERCGFQYHADLAALSPSARQAYGKTLDDITYVPADAAPDSPIFITDDSGAYYSDKGHEFKRLLAATCTYDSDGDYFGKWTAKARKHPHRSYIGPNLSPTYLSRTTAEYELEQGYDYAFLTADTFQRLYQLIPHGNGYKLNPIMGFADGDVIPGSDSSPLDAASRPDVIIFRARHGFKSGDAAHGAKMPSFHYHRVTAGAFQRLADPEREVESDLGKKASTKLHARSDFDWFVELAKLRFTDKMYAFDIKQAMKDAKVDSVNDLAWLPQLRAKLGAELKSSLEAWAGDNPVRKSAIARTREVVDNQDLLLVPQGRMISDDQKFVGADADFAYLRDLKHDVTVKMPRAAFVADLAERLRYTTMYENSEGVIYFSQLVVWGGLAAMGGAFVPGMFAARTVYKEIVNRIRNKVVSAAVQKVVIYELPALAALISEVVASLYDQKEWAAFARGFFKGYAINTLKKVFLDLSPEGMARAVFKEYDLYLRIKAVRQTVKRLQRSFETLSAKLTRKHIDELEVSLKNTARHAGIGAFALFQSIAFLEHSDADDLLTGLSAAVTEDAFDRVVKSEWATEAKEGIVSVVEGVGEFLTGKGRPFFNAVDGAFEYFDENPNLIEAAVLGYTAIALKMDLDQLRNVGSAPKTSGKKIAWVIAGVVGAGVVAHLATGGSSTDLLLSVDRLLFEGLPGRNEPDALLRGEILGNLMGAVIFDHGMVGGASILGRLAKHTTIGHRVRKKVKVGIIMPVLSALLNRYVRFYRGLLGHDGVKGDIDELLVDVAHWRTDSPDLERFEDFRATSDTGFDLHDIAVAILKADRFLVQEARDRWMERWGTKLDRYEEDLASFRADIHTLGIDALVKKHGPIVGHALLTHLKTLVRSIRNALAEMVKEVDVTNDDGSRVSLMRVFEMVGFDVKNLDKLENEFDQDASAWAKDYKA